MRSVNSRLRKLLGTTTLLVIAVLSLTATGIASNNISAQNKKVGEISTQLTPADINKKIAEIGRLLGQLETVRKTNVTGQQEPSGSVVQEQEAKLRELQTRYQQLLTALKKQEDLLKEEDILRKKLALAVEDEISQKPPFSLSFYDSLLDQLDTVEQQKETLNLALEMAKRSLETAQGAMEDAERKLRRLKEELQAARSDQQKAQIEDALKDADLQMEIAQVAANFQAVHLENLRKQLAFAELHESRLKKNIRWLRSHIHFDPADLEKQLKGIEQKKVRLQERYKRLIGEQTGIEARWLEAQRLAATAKGEKELALRHAVLITREAWKETYQKVIEQTEDMLQLLNQQAEVWRHRYTVVKGAAKAGELDDWKKETRDQLKRIERKIELLQREQSNWQAQIVNLEKKLSEANLDPTLRPIVRGHLTAVTRLAERGNEYLSVLLDSRRLNRRFLDEIISKATEVSLSQTLNKIGKKLISAWNFELWAIGGHSVTVKKVCFAIFILIIGMVVLKYCIRLMRKRLLPRVSLEPSAVAAFEKLFYYFSLLVIVIVALRIVNIPLTAFTFLGGAIAIGVGFGAQNLINNFISGFIIMAERPIKIGDLIEIEQTIAVVEGIGARCTRIRTGDNVHILVPNSSFLEKNIINWTLSDKMVRAHVTVGVAYGSPVMEVRNLLIKAAREHEDVLQQPEPFVLFTDFGDNALVFTLYFWVSMTRLLKRRIIESDIRYRVDELFREAGIVIAFPQLDVHFDSNSPLKLQLLNKDDTGHSFPRK